MSNDLEPDNEPQPWWPCPECGSVHWSAVGVFYKDDKGGGFFTSYIVGGPDVDLQPQCVACGMHLDIADHYNWNAPIAGRFERKK